MSANTENIEAKLCAYVDGDINEAERLEIEKHLQAHPTHRALLDELKQTKMMLQSLPREGAPPELSETLTGQLERSVLLDGVGTDDVESTLKINRWPQVFAVAAVVMLAAGLGVLVYFILPEHSSRPVAFSVNKDKPAALALIEAEDQVDLEANRSSKELGKVAKGPEDGDPLNPAVTTPGGALAERLLREPADPKEAFTIGADVPTAQGAGTGFGGQNNGGAGAEASPQVVVKNAPGEIFAQPSEVASKSAGISAKPGAGGEALTVVPSAIADSAVTQGNGIVNNVTGNTSRRVYVVVSTDNLAVANGQLANYLTTNNINWQPASEPVVAGFAMNKQALGSRLNTTQFRLRSADASVAGKRSDDATARELRDNTARDGNEQAKNDADPRQDQQRQQQMNTYGVNRKENPVADTSGNLNYKQELEPGRGPLQQREAKQAEGVSAPLDQTAPSYDLASSKTETVIVARGLSRQQAVAVCDSLGKLYVGQTAVVLDSTAADMVQAASQTGGLASDSAQPTTQPGQASQSSGDAPAWPTTVPAMPGSKDETPIASGQTWSQSPAVSMKGKYPSTEVDKALDATTQPTTQPKAELTLTPPSTQPVAQQVALAATEQQVLPTSPMNLNPPSAPQLADEALDVVIVVQPAVSTDNDNAQAPNQAASPLDPVAGAKESGAINVPTTAPATQPLSSPDMPSPDIASPSTADQIKNAK